MIAGYGLFPSLFNLVYIKDGDIEKDERHESKIYKIIKYRWSNGWSRKCKKT